MISIDPKILGMAFLGGIVPSLLWLWFWVKRESNKPEPKSVLLMIFIMGMIAIVCVLPIQKFIQAHIDSHQWQLVLWAGAEEIIKYLAVLIVLYRTKYIDEPIEWPIY